jgi:hypothetical protein
MKLLNWLANKIWVATCRKGSRLFWKDLKDISMTQEKVLLAIISANTKSSYGQEHRFFEIGSISEFQEKVPLTTYDDYAPYLERICLGESGVLTTEPVLLLELSSGSTSVSKYIPYTKRLKDEFQQGISPWIYDLNSKCEGLFLGKSYWSITPVENKKSLSKGGIPIGFQEDSQYFGLLEQILLDYLFAVPKEVKDIDDMSVFRYITLLFLLKEKNLTFVSVWNPSFFTLLLKPLTGWMEGLINDLASGVITAPGKLSADLKSGLEKKLGINPSRAGKLRQILQLANDEPGAFHEYSSLYEAIWPNLKLISCWTDANADISARELQKYFPSVIFQGKGLLATEGFVSFPLMGLEGAILSVRSHFFEFIEYHPANDDGVDKVKLAHELEAGKIYSIVLTTGGGFYRYQLQDLVKVIGFTAGCPRIKFMGKEEKVCDYRGEKLNEFHVGQVIEQALKKHELTPCFYMLAPEVSGEGTCFYVLYLELEEQEINPYCLYSLTDQIEAGLQENFHYNYCRKLGQLDGLKLFLIKSEDGCAATENYHRVCRLLGQKAGDIKPVALHQKTGWASEFPGEFIEG